MQTSGSPPSVSLVGGVCKAQMPELGAATQDPGLEPPRVSAAAGHAAPRSAASETCSSSSARGRAGRGRACRSIFSLKKSVIDVGHQG